MDQLTPQSGHTGPNDLVTVLASTLTLIVNILKFQHGDISEGLLIIRPSKQI